MTSWLAVRVARAAADEDPLEDGGDEEKRMPMKMAGRARMPRSRRSG
jgi:hypothetical protein